MFHYESKDITFILETTKSWWAIPLAIQHETWGTPTHRRTTSVHILCFHFTLTRFTGDENVRENK